MQHIVWYLYQLNNELTLPSDSYHHPLFLNFKLNYYGVFSTGTLNMVANNNRYCHPTYLMYYKGPVILSAKS